MHSCLLRIQEYHITYGTSLYDSVRYEKYHWKEGFLKLLPFSLKRYATFFITLKEFIFWEVEDRHIFLLSPFP